MIVQTRKARNGRDDPREVAAAAHDRLQESPRRAVRAKGAGTGIRMAEEPKQLAKGTRRPDDTARAPRGKRKQQTKSWQHPLDRRVRVPYRIAAAIAVMEMGISDYAVIAEAVGLTVEEVRRIDSAEDPSVRQLAVAKIPVGEFFKLVTRVRCPKCRNDVGVAPCVGCCSY